MYLNKLNKLKKPNGDIYLSIREKYHVPKKGSRERIIESIGYVNALKDKYDDPIAFFTQRAPEFVQRDDRIKAHFLICFLSLLNYRLLEKQLGSKYTCQEILRTLKAINFVNIEGQGFIPTYKRDKITDDLHETCKFRTDFQFITKGKMKEIQKQSKRR